MNSLGVSRKQLKSLVSEIDRRSAAAGGRTSGPPSSPDRQYARWNFAIETVPAQLHHPGGSSVNLRLAARNLSAGGMALLHNGFVHTDSRVTISLPLRTGGTLPVGGRIVRCSHLGGVVHELGVQFDQTIDLQLVKTNDGDWFTLERVDPSLLEGRVVYIGGSAVTRNVFRNHLRDTQLRMAEADDLDAASEALDGDCDVIIYDVTCEPEISIAIREKLKESDGPPCIAICSKEDGSSTVAAASLEPDAAISAPADEITLLRALAELLIVRKERLREAG